MSREVAGLISLAVTLHTAPLPCRQCNWLRNDNAPEALKSRKKGNPHAPVSIVGVFVPTEWSLWSSTRLVDRSNHWVGIKAFTPTATSTTTTSATPIPVRATTTCKRCYAKVKTSPARYLTNLKCLRWLNICLAWLQPWRIRLDLSRLICRTCPSFTQFWHVQFSYGLSVSVAAPPAVTTHSLVEIKPWLSKASKF